MSITVKGLPFRMGPSVSVNPALFKAPFWNWENTEINLDRVHIESRNFARYPLSIQSIHGSVFVKVFLLTRSLTIFENVATTLPINRPMVNGDHAGEISNFQARFRLLNKKSRT